LHAGKFGGILAAMPQPIVAAILCMTFGMVGKYLLIIAI
jgi:xanthine/uracil permease